MATEWKNVRQQIKAFKNYINSLSVTAKATAAYSYVLTTSDIDSLLNQKGNGTRLAGIRIYFGAEIVNGDLVPRMYAVGSDLVNSSYDDYNVPITGIDLETAATATANAAMPLKCDGLPCPTSCGKLNVMNS